MWCCVHLLQSLCVFWANCLGVDVATNKASASGKHVAKLPCRSVMQPRLWWFVRLLQAVPECMDSIRFDMYCCLTYVLVLDEGSSLSSLSRSVSCIDSPWSVRRAVSVYSVQ